MATTPNLPATPKLIPLKIASGATSGTKSSFTLTADMKFVGAFATSLDGTGRDVVIGITRSAVDYQMGRQTVAANAGNATGTVNQNMLAGMLIGLPTDNDGQTYFFANSGDVIYVAPQATTTGDIIVHLIGSTF